MSEFMTYSHEKQTKHLIELFFNYFVHQQLQDESLWLSITKSFFLDRVKDEGLMLETSAF